jgi:hypothetical protein
MNARILETMNQEIAKAKYDIEMKGIEYDTRVYHNDEMKEHMARSEYKEETVNRKLRLIKRNEYELEMISIQKRMLELELEQLEDKKRSFISATLAQVG